MSVPSSSIPASKLLEGFSVLIHFLLDAEADCLCGVSLYQRSDQRTNYRSGFYKRKLSTSLGPVSLRVVHLKYFHPRPSLLKRAKRLSDSILDSLAQIHANGSTSDQAASLIKSLWVLHLPDQLLQVLSFQLIAQLEAWRAGISINPASSPLVAQPPAEAHCAII